MGIESLAASLPGILGALPDLFFLVQVIVFLGLIWFFGHIAIEGYRGYAGFIVKSLARLGLGFIALIGGYSLAPFIPLPPEIGYFRIFQLDILMGGIFYSILLLIAVYMVSHNMFNVSGMERAIKKLQEKLQKAKSLGNLTRKERLRDPYKIVGVVLIGIFVIFALLYFPGFPNYYEEMLGTLGVTSEDIQGITQALGDLPDPVEGCVSPISVTLANREALLSQTLPPSTNEAAKALMESESGEAILLMYLVSYEGKEYSLGFTETSAVCLANSEQSCGCITNMG